MNRESSPRHVQETALCILFDEAPHALEGRSYVQKLMFLFQQETGENWFDFEPWDYGPFSRELYQVVDYCTDYDYVTEEEIEADDGVIRYHYSAGAAIDDVFGHGDHDDLRAAARSVFDEYPTDDLKELLDAVYTEYPAWARNSVY